MLRETMRFEIKALQCKFNFTIIVAIRDGKVYARGDMEQPTDLRIPQDAAREMVVATRPRRQLV